MEDENEGRHFQPLSDPAKRPVEQAAQLLARCHLPAQGTNTADLMLCELRAAIAEFSPLGMFRTADTRLAAQSAVLDQMFHISASRAVRIQKDFSGNEFIYLDKDDANLTLKIQNQYRRVIEGLKTDSRDVERINLARNRLEMEARRRK